MLFISLGAGGWEGSEGIGTQPAYAVFHPGQLKKQSYQNVFYLVATKNEHYVLFTSFGYCVPAGGGGVRKGLAHNLLMHFFTVVAQE